MKVYKMKVFQTSVSNDGEQVVRKGEATFTHKGSAQKAARQLSKTWGESIMIGLHELEFEGIELNTKIPGWERALEGHEPDMTTRIEWKEQEA